MNKEKLKRGVRMNKKIDINKFNKSITFQNRGIGFTQIGVAGEILNLIDDLQQENNQLKGNWNELKKWLEENESFDDYCNETTFTSVLDKMQELEQGSDSDE